MKSETKMDVNTIVNRAPGPVLSCCVDWECWRVLQSVFDLGIVYEVACAFLGPRELGVQNGDPDSKEVRLL